MKPNHVECLPILNTTVDIIFVLWIVSLDQLRFKNYNCFFLVNTFKEIIFLFVNFNFRKRVMHLCGLSTHVLTVVK